MNTPRRRVGPALAGQDLVWLRASSPRPWTPALLAGLLAIAPAGCARDAGSSATPRSAATPATTTAPPASAALAPRPPAGTPTPRAADTSAGIGAWANAQAPGSAVVTDRQPWSFGEAPGQVIRTRHFAIFTTEREPIITERLPGFLEAAIPHYRGIVGPLPPPPYQMEVFIMATRGQWQDLTLSLLGARGVPLTAIERGGFAVGGRALFFDLGPADTFSVTAHEGWHQYTQTTFRTPLPLWAEEGLATLMEGHRWTGNALVFLPWANLERYDKLRDAHARQTLLSLPELLSVSPEQLMAQGPMGQERAVTYYAQLWALLHFLREGQGGRYREALHRMVADAAAGLLPQAVALSLGAERPRALASVSGPAVFKAYFGGGPEEFEPAYRAFVAQVIRPGGRDAAVAGRSPVND